MRFLGMLVVLLLLSSCAVFPSSVNGAITLEPWAQKYLIITAQKDQNHDKSYLVTSEKSPYVTGGSWQVENSSTTGLPVYRFLPYKDNAIPLAEDVPDHTIAWLEQWVPVRASKYSNLVLEGPQFSGKLSIASRDDCDCMQVLYNGWPLYFFKGDEPGEMPQGEMSGVWEVVPASVVPIELNYIAP
jgi:Secreted repeat of unknown function